MTSDGVDGTAAEDRACAALCDRPPGWLRIKRDDERLAPRYMQHAYPHTPAGGVTPHRLRRERQVASALHNRTDLTIANLICGAAGSAGRPRAGVRPRLRPSRRRSKGLR